VTSLGQIVTPLAFGFGDEPFELGDLVAEDLGAGTGVALGKELVADLLIVDDGHREQFEESGGGKVLALGEFAEGLGDAETAERPVGEGGLDVGPHGGEALVVLGGVGGRDADGFEHRLAVEGLFVGGHLADDACPAHALDQDVVSTVGKALVLHDLGDADGGLERGSAVVLELPAGALEDGGGELAGTVEGSVDHLAVAGLEDVQGLDLLGEEQDGVEREERHGPPEVDGDGGLLRHGWSIQGTKPADPHSGKMPGNPETTMKARAFTLIELLFLLLILGLFGGVLLPSWGRARALERSIKDGAYIRGIHQSLIMFSQKNNDLYPLPSVLDKNNATVDVGSETGLKDNPKNVVSLLIYNGFFEPRLTVSAAESNADIVVDSDYSYSEPKSAKDPKKALWDPSYKGPPGPAGQGARDEEKGNLSYAMSVFIGARRKAWSYTFIASEAMIGNRGPWYELVGDAWRLSEGKPADALAYEGTVFSATASHTLLIHGKRTAWEGNVVFNDNHVEYQGQPDPARNPWTFKDLAGPNKVRLDNLFVSEDDDLRTADADSLATPGALTRKNNYLRLWQGGTAKGADLLDLKGAWFAD